MARASEQNRSVSTSEVPIVGNVRKPRNISSTECGTLIFDANFECGKGNNFAWAIFYLILGDFF